MARDLECATDTPSQQRLNFHRFKNSTGEEIEETYLLPSPYSWLSVVKKLASMSCLRFRGGNDRYRGALRVSMLLKDEMRWMFIKQRNTRKAAGEVALLAYL